MLQIVIEGSTYKDLLVNLDKINLEYNGPTRNEVVEIDDPVIGCAPTAGGAVEVRLSDIKDPNNFNADIVVQEEGDDSLDSRGIKYDATIHSAKKTKTAKGAWRTRRNIAATHVKTVEEKQGSTDVTHIGGPTPLPTVAPAPTAEIPIAAVVPPVVTGGHTLETFKANVIGVFADLVKNKKLTKEYIAQLNTYFEVKEIWEIMRDDEKVSELFENFVQAGLVIKVDA